MSAAKLQQFPEQEYGKLGSKERRKNLQKNAWLLTNYGITLAEYRIMLAAQDGRCEICGTSETDYRRIKDGKVVEMTFAVDHDHRTGEVRGLLCSKCNKGLGLFNDDPELLKVALGYLVGG